jgi:hypothetical protein
MFGKTLIPERTTVRHPRPLSAGDDACLKVSGKILTFSVEPTFFDGDNAGINISAVRDSEIHITLLSSTSFWSRILIHAFFSDDLYSVS